jgi:hypothetical protein
MHRFTASLRSPVRQAHPFTAGIRAHLSNPPRSRHRSTRPREALPPSATGYHTSPARSLTQHRPGEFGQDPLTFSLTFCRAPRSVPSLSRTLVLLRRARSDLDPSQISKTSAPWFCKSRIVSLLSQFSLIVFLFRPNVAECHPHPWINPDRAER